MNPEATFAESDGGGRIVLPFPLNPSTEDTIATYLKANTTFLRKGQNGAPWTGYFAIWYGIGYTIQMYQGVWFEIRYNEERNKWYAFRVAQDLFDLQHEPTANMNLDERNAPIETQPVDPEKYNSIQQSQQRSGQNPFLRRRNNKATTEEERQRYRLEGRCFTCGRQGHINRNCPNQKPSTNATPTLTPQTPNDVSGDFIRKMAEFSARMTQEQQDLLARELVLRGANFSESTGPTAWIRALVPDSVFVPKINALRITVHFLQSEENAKIEALVDTGATHNFMTKTWQYSSISSQEN
ncbi:hypothetical protein EDB87DRAFT_1630364 [Lactarius vividus]|nr:hypothetical protein EDB87DRAFT_1630364 [Lactarius vividus]